MKRLIGYIKYRWGLFLLIALLIVIAVVNIEPHLYLAGWDNFSSTLNIPLNAGRSFLLTWRDNRGFGVPSDSEMVDIFRLIISAPVATLFGTRIVDQLYYAFCLWSGLIGVYFLFIEIFNTKKRKSGARWILELGALCAALFYLFNLNTLATFYAPIMMFITRFWLYPWVLYLLLKIYKRNEVSLKDVLLLFVVALLGSAAYLTGTTFIVLAVILCVIFIFQLHPFEKKIKGRIYKTILIGVLFLAINAFWFIPFVNFATHNSDSVTYTSNNVSINEHILNAPPQSYSWYRNMVMYPDILDLSGGLDQSMNNELPFHQNGNFIKTDTFSRIFLLSFAFIALIGSIAMVLIKRKFGLLFIPLLIMGILFILRRDLPPFGFMFEFLSEAIPYFEVIFRFGETKFMPVYSLLGSIAAAYFVLKIAELVNESFSRAAVKFVVFGTTFILIFLPSIFIFRSYFTGALLSDDLKVDIPKAYSEIANTIDSDPDAQRVLHLPFDEFSYWRVHDWGYFGSSFINYIMETPVHDRTFEPGSFENDDFIWAVLQSVKYEDSERLYQLLKVSGTTHIIVDNSVNQHSSARGKEIWGEFYKEETAKVIEALERSGQIDLMASEEIDLYEIAQKYPTWNTLTNEEKDALSNSIVDVYKVHQTNPDFEIISEAETVDDAISILRNENQFKTRYVQTTKRLGNSYPFMTDNLQIDNESDPHYSTLSFSGNLGFLSQPDDASDVNMLGIYLKEDSQNVYIGFNLVPAPLFEKDTMAGQKEFHEVVIPKSRLSDNAKAKPAKYTSDWRVLDLTQNKELYDQRIAVGGVVVPLPVDLDSQYQYYGSVIANSWQVGIEILTPADLFKDIHLELQPTEDSNCTADKTPFYDYLLSIEGGTTKLRTTAGSSCATAYLNNEGRKVYPYYESYIDYQIEVTRLGSTDSKSEKFHAYSSEHQKANKKVVNDYQPNALLKYCLIDAETSGCMNTHEGLAMRGDRVSTIVPNSTINSEANAQILLTLPNVPAHETSLEVSKLDVTGYSKMLLEEFSISQLPDIEYDYSGESTTLFIPKALSLNSYYHTAEYDAFNTFTNSCSGNALYRNSVVPDDKLVLYHENCSTFSSVFNNHNPSSLYLWGLNYNLLAGKYPRFVLFPERDEIVSRYSQVGRIENFKQLEQPDVPFKSVELQKISEIIESSPTRTDYIFLQPAPDNESSYREFRIEQDGRNQGILRIDGLTIQELPPQWSELSYSFVTSDRSYCDADVANVDKLRADLYKIQLKEIDRSGDKILLKFGQGYDPQWEIYNTDSALLTIFGFNKIESEQVKVDGWANGWEIEVKAIDIDDEGASFVVIYTPLRLAIIGGLITVATMFALVGYVILRDLKRAKRNE